MIDLIQAIRTRPGMYFGEPRDALRNFILYIIEYCLNPHNPKLTVQQRTSTEFVFIRHSSFSANELTLTDEINYFIAACRYCVVNTAGNTYYFQAGYPSHKAEVLPFFQPLPAETYIALQVDPSILPRPEAMSSHALAEYCKPLALTNRSYHITIECPAQTHTIYYPDGIKNHLAEISAFRTIATEVMHASYHSDLGTCSIALCLAHTGADYIQLIVNNTICTEGGDLVEQLCHKLTPDLEDARYAVIGIIQLLLDAPNFYGSTKDRLSDARGAQLVEECSKKIKDELITSTPFIKKAQQYPTGNR